MRTIIIALFMMCCLYGTTQTNDTIKWNGPERQLKISDFRHEPDKSSPYAAISNIARPAEWYTKRDTLFIKMNSEFIRGQSWFNQERGNPESHVILLSHEQGHFDIGELEVRKTKQQLYNNAATMDKKNYKAIVSKYISELGKNLDKMNDLYDKETNFSTNIGKQKEWTAKLAKEMQALDKFKGDDVIIPLRK